MAEPRNRSISRRHLFGAAAAGVTGLGVGASLVGNQSRAAVPADGMLTEPFYGRHQAGVLTKPQAHAQFIGLDMSAGSTRESLSGILKVWTEDAARLTSGKPGLADTEPELASAPARLTITVGLGPGAFAVIGDNYKPEWLQPLPPFSIDEIDKNRWGQTDIVMQICSDDPISLAHATRVLLKNVRSQVQLRWIQRGFRNARHTQPENVTMRNLMGQVDGTVNIAPEEFDQLVWNDGNSQPWLQFGTSMVLRRIHMKLDTWEEIDRSDRELTIGRTLDTGAPLTGSQESDTPDFSATGNNGISIIPPSSHIARAHRQNFQEQIYRRAYNYDDPPEAGQLSNSGLIFVSYQKNITTQFVPIQQRLADFDALNQWTTPIGSAVYAVFPGISPGNHLGHMLFDK